MPVDIKNKLAFIHIPKNGGTSICKSLGMKSNHETFIDIFRRHPNFTFFTTIRDPFDRFISAYEYVKMEKSYWHDTNNPHPLYQKFKNIDFEQSCDLLKSGKLSKYFQFKPQSDFLKNQNNQIDKNIKIFKLEDLEKLRIFLKDNFNISTEFKRVNVSNRSSNTYYNEYTRNIILNFYKKDFDMYEHSCHI